MTTVAGIVSVLLVAVGLFYTNAANREQQQLNTRGQVADRFSAAIDHLGQEDQKLHDKLSIRLGGIYALQQLMVDSPRDRPAVIQVLCAFVRTHALSPENRPSVVPPASIDVRAVVAVLGSRPSPQDTKLDFSYTLLGLRGIDLHGSDMTGADLTGADLRGADLTGADLAGVNIAGADLTGSDLTGADLRTADLTGANLSDVGLAGAALQGAHIAGADLSGARLGGQSDPDTGGRATITSPRIGESLDLTVREAGGYTDGFTASGTCQVLRGYRALIVSRADSGRGYWLLSDGFLTDCVDDNVTHRWTAARVDPSWAGMPPERPITIGVIIVQEDVADRAMTQKLAGEPIDLPAPSAAVIVIVSRVQPD